MTSLAIGATLVQTRWLNADCIRLFTRVVSSHSPTMALQNYLFGTYTDRGFKTCGGRPGALGFESLDAQTYADWGM
jgi:hypothetical protein